MENKKALITGAGRGIGAATAELLSLSGYDVAIVARSKNELESVQQSITMRNGSCRIFPVDLRNPLAIDELFQTLQTQWNHLDVLVNNAAKIVVEPLESMTLSTWNDVLAINLTAPYLCAQHAFAMMKANHGGVIVNIASISGVYGPLKFKGFGAYAASKYGLIGLTEILSIEGAAYNIRVNAISPGSVDTMMLKQAAPHLKPDMSPEEVAQVILFLVKDTGKPFNGRNIELF